MLFHITHHTMYRYDVPVFLEPHRFRFLPRSCPSQRVKAFRLAVSPQPQAWSDELDPQGNGVSHAWFAGTVSVMDVQATIEVMTLRTNPFDFLPTPGGDVLPLSYGPDIAPFLAPYGQRSTLGPVVEALAKSLSDEAKGKVIPFLTLLTKKLYTDIHYVRREDEFLPPPDQTLLAGEGSCRDATLVFMDVCRCLGFAARFVSGYQAGDQGSDRRDLHAWAEVYIPGGGWRGFDPTLGLAVADRHVAIAASSTAEVAAPITGSFRGPTRSADMQTQISIHMEP